MEREGKRKIREQDAHLAHGFDSVVIWYLLGVLPDFNPASITLFICYF